MPTRGLLQLAWVELKLFFREPIAIVFGFAFPLMILVVLLAVFGDSVGDATFYEASGTDFYVPAYIATVIAAIALISMPVHVAGYIERGVLRRLRASGVRGWIVLVAQAVVAVLSIVVGAILIMGVAALAYDLGFPSEPGMVALGIVLGTLAFLAFGALIAVLVRTARAAQAAGLLLFFGMFFISGAGPPRALLPEWIVTAGDWLPMTHLVSAIQDPWIGRDGGATPYLVLAALFVLGAAGASALLRRA
jgi:ABC-2 type transport system permease protein